MSDVGERSAVLVPARVTRGLRGAVASPQFLASEAGFAILRAGGSAVDAAVATNAALGVVAAYMCGLGGDAFWLIWDGERVHALNGSGAAPQGATPEAAAAAGLNEMPERGAWTVNVPGAVHSWGAAHARFGRLAWADVLAPAIELADGFAATDAWCQSVEATAVVFGTDGDWARTFRPNGRAWLPGEKVSLPALAGTLRRLAAEGPDDYYTGELAHRAAGYLEQSGSPLRAVDFASHRSEWTAPISVGYRGLTSISHPPNSSGVTALQLLGLLDRLEPGADDARWIDLCLRAAEIALADRDETLTDSRAMAPGALERLLDPARLDALAGEIANGGRPHTAATSAANGDTVYLATADATGQLVSLIESNYRGFGSGLVDPETGISYQNRGAQFSLDPAHVNVIAPGKRTAHTLTPGMLMRDGRPCIAHGSMGGMIQPQVFAQFVSAVVDRGLDIASAVARPRWSIGPAYGGGRAGVALESRFPADVARRLEELGHEVTQVEPFSSAMGHAHAVEVSGDGFAAASDPRSEGAALAW